MVLPREGGRYRIVLTSGRALVGKCVRTDGKYLSFDVGEVDGATTMLFVQRTKRGTPEVQSITLEVQ